MPQTQQGKRQQWFRDVHGKPGLTYSGDIWEAANSLVGPIGTDATVNGALLLMAKDQSGYAGNDLPGALQAWADASGEYNWSSKGAFYPFFDFRSSIPAGWTHAATGAAWFENASGLIEETNGTDPAFAYRSGTAIGVQIELEREILPLHNRDLTQAGTWTAFNGTPTRITGADGVTDSGSRLTATGADAAFSQTFVLGAAARAITVRMKRVTGTSAINVGDGTTPTDVTSQLNTSNYVRVATIETALANPKIVIDIAAAGDVVDVDFIHLEDGSFNTSDYPTGASSATRLARDLEALLADIGMPSKIEGVLRYRMHFVPNPGNTTQIVLLHNNSFAERIRVQQSSANQPQVFLTHGNSTVAALSLPAPATVDGLWDMDLEIEVSDGVLRARLNGGTIMEDLGAYSAPDGLLKWEWASDPNAATQAAVYAASCSYQPGATL